MIRSDIKTVIEYFERPESSNRIIIEGKLTLAPGLAGYILTLLNCKITWNWTSIDNLTKKAKRINIKIE